MLTPRTANIYGVIAIAVMLVMFLLMLFKQVPPSFYLGMFLIAVVLLLIRVTLRLILARQARLDRGARSQAENSQQPPSPPQA